MYFNQAFSLKRFSQQQGDTIQGPAVDNLITVVQGMIGLGAPIERNNIGFNQYDYWSAPIEAMKSAVIGSSILISVAQQVLGRLRKYKNTQVPQYDQLVVGIQELISQKTGIVVPNTGNVKRVSYVGQAFQGKSYETPLFHVPGLGNNFKSVLEPVKQAMEAQGLDTKDSWKAFYRSKQGIDVYQVKPDYFDIIKSTLQTMGYDVTDMVIPEEVVTSTPVKAIVATLNTVGQSISVGLTLEPYDAKIIEFIKAWRNRKYTKENNTWTLQSPSLEFIEGLIQLGNSLGYQTDTLEPIREVAVPSGEVIADPSKINGIRIRVQDASAATNDKWHLAFGFLKRGTDAGELFKEILRYSFPEWGANETRFNLDVFNTGYPNCVIKASYNAYRKLHDTLRHYGFDTSEFDVILKQLILNKKLPLTRVEGDLEGFQDEVVDEEGTTREVNNPDVFYKYLEDNYEKQISQRDGKEFKFYPAQKEGVAFLYGRQSSLLGDSTGVGKTLQLIVAADMRRKIEGGNILVITINDIVQRQWIEEIKRFTGVDDTEISTDPTHGAPWTVMTYHNFSQKNTRDYNISVIQEQVKNNQVTCCLLDEVDSVKNEGSKRTENVQSITSFDDKEGNRFTIPFVSGASATIVANRPIDVYNQLKAINHPAGRMSYYTFATQLGGMTKTGRYGLKTGSLDEQLDAANKLKEWLVNWGVYIQRTKKDVRGDMPEHIISEVNTPIDDNEVSLKAAARAAGYKDPTKAVSLLMSMRAELAIAKVPEVVKQMRPILERGDKVAVFTMFRESQFQLALGLRQILDAQGQGGEVVSITGGMQRERKADIISRFKDLNSNVQACVIMTSTGGTGMDCPNVTQHVFVNDFDWTPRSAEQSEGRFYRIISKEDVNTKYAVANGTMDEEFYKRVQAKRQVAQTVQELTKKQMEMIRKGLGRKNSKRLEIERQLKNAFTKQQQQEEDDATFINRQAAKIRKQMEAARAKQGEKGASWFGKLRKSN